MARIPSFLTLLLDLVVKSLAVPLKAHWFLVDVTRRLGNLARLSVDYCLTAECSATAAVRTHALTSIVAISRSSVVSEHRLLIMGLPERILQLRLESIMKLEWGIVDTMMSDILAAEAVPISTSMMHTALNRLEKSDEALEVSPLLVRAQPFHSHLELRISSCRMSAIKCHKWVLNFVPSPEIDYEC